MTRIDDYAKADCTLFRLPPLDFSAVSEALEIALTEAWKQGYTASDALQQALQNSEVVDKLVGQVQESLGFQQAAAQEQLTTGLEEKKAAYEQELSLKLGEIEAEQGAQLTQYQAEVQTASEQLNTERTHYSAAQTRLEEMRARIKVRMEELGGEKKLEKLRTITKTLQEPASYESLGSKNSAGSDTSKNTVGVASENYAAQPQALTGETGKTEGAKENSSGSSLSGAEKTAEVASPAEPSASLEKKVEEAGKDKEKDSTTEKKSYGFFKKVWDVLNYKLW